MVKEKTELPATYTGNSMLTFVYSIAAVSLVVATASIVAVVAKLFTFWTGASSFGFGYELIWLFGGGYGGVVSLVIFAALFAVLSFIMYKKTSGMIATDLAYLKTKTYNFITNGLVAVFLIATICFLAETLSALFSSLLLIGSGFDIGGLYLGQFLPDVIGLLFVGGMGYMAFKIMKGQNLSFAMTLSTLVAVGLLFIAVFITVPIKAHQGTDDALRTMRQYQMYQDVLNY